jgi:hypothetical protein
MPWVGFEPTIAAFELAKTIHALDSAAIVISINVFYRPTKIALIDTVSQNSISA